MKSQSADFLSDISVAVVIALQERDKGRTKMLINRMTELEEKAKAGGDQAAAAYFRILRGLLRGVDVGDAAETLAEPYRSAYQRIEQELGEEAMRGAGETSSDWLATLTSIVATTVKHGNKDEKANLERELASIARKAPREEKEFQDFMAVLRNILRGKDTRRLAARLQPPYRQAHQSLLELLAADDSIDFTVLSIIDRIQHNTIVALTKGDRRLQLEVAEALADIEEALPEDDPKSPHFRALMAGAIALLIDRQPPKAVNRLPEPFAEAWEKILEASQQT